MIPPPPTVKGRCPGALLPMPAKDGLIMRVRPKLSRLTAAQFAAIVQASARFGDGHVHLTNRANVQIRAVVPEVHQDALEALRAEGLIDATAEDEAARNVAVCPKTALGLAPAAQKVARTLEVALLAEPALKLLPPKFGYSVQAAELGGGIDADAPGDLIIAVPGGEEVFVIPGGAPEVAVAVYSPHQFVSLLVDIAQSFLRLKAAHAKIKRLRDAVKAFGASCLLGPAVMPHGLPLSPPRPAAGLLYDGAAYGLGFLFGDIEPSAAQALAALMRDENLQYVAVSAARTLAFPLAAPRQKAALSRFAAEFAAMDDPDDGRLTVHACGGHRLCEHASLDTRADARAVADHLAAQKAKGVVHIAGCPKFCAHFGPADVVVIAEGDHYRMVKPAHGAKDWISQADLPAFIAGLL